MKILIFYAPFGGGHLTPALTLQESINCYQNEQCPDLKRVSKTKSEVSDSAASNGAAYNNKNIQVTLIDGTGKTNLLKKILIWFYSISATQFDWLWALFYFTSSNRLVIDLYSFLTGFILIPQYVRLIKSEKPDKIITTYFIAHLLHYAVKYLKLNIQIVTVITDPFTFRPAWVRDKSLNIIVFSQQAKKQALQFGLDNDKIMVCDPLVKKQFLEKSNANKNEKYPNAKPALKTTFEASNSVVDNKVSDNNKIIPEVKIDFSLKTILIIGGAEGLKNCYRIFQTLLLSEANYNLIFVCGKDYKSKILCQKLLSKSSNTQNINIIGYTRNVYELMSISDLIITKAGASIIFEAVTLQKPLLITSYLKNQEKGNKDYIINQRLGVYISKISDLTKKIEIIFNSKDSNILDYHKIAENYKRLNFRPDNRNLINFLLS